MKKQYLSILLLLSSIQQTMGGEVQQEPPVAREEQQSYALQAILEEIVAAFDDEEFTAALHAACNDQEIANCLIAAYQELVSSDEACDESLVGNILSVLQHLGIDLKDLMSRSLRTNSLRTGDLTVERESRFYGPVYIINSSESNPALVVNGAIVAEDLIISSGGGGFLPLAGGTMTGPINFAAFAGNAINVNGGVFIVGNATGNINTTGTLNVTGATTLNSTLSVSGLSTLNSLSVTNNATVGGTLTASEGIFANQVRIYENFGTRIEETIPGDSLTIDTIDNAGAAAGSIDLFAGDDGANIGGEILITGGTSTNPSNKGGNIFITAGDDANSTGGQITVRGARDIGAVRGGDIVLEAGHSGSNLGGKIKIGEGVGGAGQIGGDIIITLGTGGTNGSLVINNLPSLAPGTNLSIGVGNVVQKDTSSRRFKQEITPLISSSNLLLQLNPVSYRYISNPECSQFGLIAEEVYEVVPEVVPLDTEGFPESVRYDLLVTLLIKGWQEQHARLNRYEEKMKELTARYNEEIKALVYKITELESR